MRKWQCKADVKVIDANYNEFLEVVLCIGISDIILIHLSDQTVNN